VDLISLRGEGDPQAHVRQRVDSPDDIGIQLVALLGLTNSHAMHHVSPSSSAFIYISFLSTTRPLSFSSTFEFSLQKMQAHMKTKFKFTGARERSSNKRVAEHSNVLCHLPYPSLFSLLKELRPQPEPKECSAGV
jgi:hypothetical protein